MSAHGLSPSSALTRFQDAFAHALLTPGQPAPADIAPLVDAPAFAVYRNTVMKGCIDALQANYPAVTRLVGETWFRDAAAIFVRQSLPAEPMLVSYGAEFPRFLESFEPASELPYLPDVARLDRYWGEAHCAPDAAVLEPRILAGVSPDQLGTMALTPHPAARWAWFDALPIYTIWSRNRRDQVPEGEIAWRGEGALITRPSEAVQWIELGAADCAFMDACAAGKPLAEATLAALTVQENVDLTRLMATLLGSGAFRDMPNNFSMQGSHS